MDLFNIDSETVSVLAKMDDKDLSSLSTTLDESTMDGDIELNIYICFTIFRKTQSPEKLQQAIQRTDAWNATLAMDHPDRLRRRQIGDMLLAWKNQFVSVLVSRNGYLNLLGNIFRSRFKWTHSIDNLNRAVELAKMAVNATPQSNPRRAAFLLNLGITLDMRFERTGSMDDINHAVEVADFSIKIASPDDRGLSWMSSSFAHILGRRSERTGSLDDLNRAIEASQRAVDILPQVHSHRAVRLNNLGNLLGKRFERTAVDMAWLSNLGSWLSIRSRKTSSIINAVSQDHPDRITYLNNLSNCLITRFYHTAQMNDLNRAISFLDGVVNGISQDHPSRILCMGSFAKSLLSRFEKTDSIDDLNRALSSFNDGWNCHTASPSDRIKMAKGAAPLSQLLREAHTDKQHMLAEFSSLASDSAAACLNAAEGRIKEEEAYDALRFLELGRGIIAGLLMDMRVDVSDLRQKYPDLAEKFVSLRDELDLPADVRRFPSHSGDMVGDWESQAKRRREADQGFSELLPIIRTKPGFHNFLLPPTRDELMAAADPDPIIVVNISSYRCDAFLIEHYRIRVIKLPDLTLEDVRKQVRDLRSADMTSILEWLWEAICRPCLDALGFQTSIDNCPHVWWVPTGLLSQLPLHAAGLHSQGSTDTVLDRVMSSYASSIKALVHGRRHHSDNPSQSPFNQALLVAMNITPGINGNRDLQYAKEEIDMLKSICSSLQLVPVTPARYKRNIMESLRGCKVFHFAGHGRLNPVEPSQSCLLLDDWETDPLTVGDLRDHKLQGNLPFLGYLSACSTGSNKAENLADEAIHLVGALQLAGFRHVVGTLWEVSDSHCVDVARVLYETLHEGITDTAVYRGIHRAIKRLRDNDVESVEKGRDGILVDLEAKARVPKSFYWVPYIHFGV
ncbi:CHAT domain-containing protein [Annulohypoxylon truncatum]|uniref:CHAT domain-containing protein n=1 Tax=Annulohypoxylon truncatum TaxID=327061 RepID=UPI002007EF31|nr:CHAT domain-containing protein [Annulohypoxylon truncatum]KAI1204903.1 CHAT domain-containing protein [Annulohypoxylon truncatum]